MISKKYKEVIKNLEDNIDSKRDLDFAKKQISDLTVLYIDELTKVVKNLEAKIENFENKISSLEENIKKLEELYDNFEDDSMFDLESITCPYCEFKFLIENDSTKSEIKCPECNNLIQLDWEEYEEDM